MSIEGTHVDMSGRDRGSRVSSDTPPTRRLHGLDALRASALLLGILLHGLMPFEPAMGWMVVDTRPATWAMPTIAIIHLFRMALFMLLAGYFARIVVGRRGMRRYLRERTLRIAAPVFAFWPVAVLPLGLVAAWWHEAHGLPLPRHGGDGPSAAFSPGHLWFLWTLYQCCLLLALTRWVAHRWMPEATAALLGRVGTLLRGPGAVGVLALPYLGSLLWQAHHYFGVDEPRTLLPDAAVLLAYLPAVGAGWVLARESGSLEDVARRWPAHLCAAGVGSVAVVLLSNLVETVTPTPALHVACAVVSALTAWCWVYGLLGLCVARLRSERGWVRYLADASYWMYLMHLPIVVAVGGLLTHLDQPPAFKLLVTLTTATAILLLTYDAFVRSTWIGGWLNGHRWPRALIVGRPRPRSRGHRPVVP